MATPAERKRVGFSLCQMILFFMCIKICEDFRNQRSGNQFLLLTSCKHQSFRSLNLWHLSPTRHWKVVAPPPRKSTERSGWWTLGSFVLRDLKETQLVEQRWPFFGGIYHIHEELFFCTTGDIILVYHNCDQSLCPCCLVDVEPLAIVYPSIHPSIHLRSGCGHRADSCSSRSTTRQRLVSRSKKNLREFSVWRKTTLLGVCLVGSG